MRRRGWAAAAGLLLAVAGCGRAPRASGDLDAIRASGELRVIVRPGFAASPLHGAGSLDEPALLRHLAARLGVRLRLVEAPRHDLVLPWLERGRGDLAVARFSPAGLREAGFEASAAVAWVEDVVVSAPRLRDRPPAPAPPVVVHRSAFTGVLTPAAVAAIGRGVQPVPEELPLEEVVRRVRQGRWAAAVADSAVVEVVGGGPQGFAAVEPLGERRALVWAVRRSDRALRAAVDRFLFAEQVLLRSRRTAACRDLDGVRRARVLRLVTRNSPVTCSVERGGLAGFEYELASAFARRLGVRLELVIPPPGADPLRWLEQGFGDLLALHEPVGPEVRRRFAATRPYRRVELVAVTAGQVDPPAAVQDLEGRTVAASAFVAELLALLPLEPAPRMLDLPAGADGLNALAQLERGQAEIAVVDADTAELERYHSPVLQLGATVLPAGELVWLLERSAGELTREADRFLASEGAGLAVRLARTELAHGRRWAAPHLADLEPGALSPYDPALRTAAEAHGLDWRLLASLMYEESRFDARAVGPGGSAGPFQFMPDTWRELAVRDPYDPAEAAQAAALYLARLMEEFPGLEPADRVAMAIASYNVGPRHLEDARRLAQRMGLDPDRWDGNVETATVLLDDPEVARQFPAGVCRCRRAVNYTRRILRRYHAYAEQYGLWKEPAGVAEVPAPARLAAP